MKVEVTYVDGRDEEAVAKALPGARLLHLFGEAGRRFDMRAA
ncbi:hypothetical protein [Shinella sp.]